MAIRSPEQRVWWNEPVERGELVWIGIAFLWGLVMFFMMVWWHFSGEQNLSNEAYRIHPDDFAVRAEEMTEQHTVRDEGGYPVVHPPPGSDVYMIARLWEWWPILELEQGQSYGLHLSSMDWQHGFSLQPENINIQVHPGYDLVMEVTPDETGEFTVVCNEYCGIGHHTMVGKIYVVEPSAEQAGPAAEGG